MSSLNPPMLFRLDLACKPLVEAFGHTPYLVGSYQERKDGANSDVDVRMILPDEEYDVFITSPELRTILCMAFTSFLRELSGLPIDFQFQKESEANMVFGGKQRNPLGGRNLTAWSGDSSMSPQDILRYETRRMKPEVAAKILEELKTPAKKTTSRKRA